MYVQGYTSPSLIFCNWQSFCVKYDAKRAQADYRVLRVLGLKLIVSYKIQDLDASGSGDLDGQECIMSGDGHSRAPYSNWNDDDSEVNFNSNDSDYVNSNYSAPALGTARGF